MDKKYIEEQYRLAMLDFFTAKNEDELNQKFKNPEKGDVDMVNKYLNNVLEELKNDPELKDLRMPDEWDADFRKIIEETVELTYSEE